MRWIQKKNEPPQLAQWRARYAGDINFGYKLMRGDEDVVKAIIDTLLEEQGYLCAYTGLRIEDSSCHIEHVRPQEDCFAAGEAEQTVAYTNMVACYPSPNQKGKTLFGAVLKGNWPSTQEAYLFISPLTQSCEDRFTFTLQGKIKYREGDAAAEKTIEKLGLNEGDLINARHGAIQGILGKTNNLRLKDARKRLQQLEHPTRQRLEPFCFVLTQSLKAHIKRLEKISQRKNKQANQMNPKA